MSPEIEQCHQEIARTEARLHAGYPDIHGLCLALSDWHMELLLLEGEPQHRLQDVA
jgi:hypothetical protein